MTSAGHTRVLLAAAVALAALVVFWPVRAFEFLTYDDPLYVTGNAHVLDGVTVDGLRWAFTTNHSSNWHPLTWLSLMADAEMYGARPRGFHTTALALHATNAVLLFLLFVSMTRAPGRSAMVAALFAVHPLHVESVAWVAARKDLLSTLFGLVSLMAWVAYVREGSRARYGLSLLAYAASLLAKQMLVTLPFLLLLLDVWPLERGRLRWTRRLGEKLPFLVLAVAASAAALWAQSSGGAMRDLQQFPLGSRLGNAAIAYVAYAWRTLVPVDLAAFYPYPPPISPWRVAAALALLGVVTLAVLRLPRRPYLAVGWLWYLGTLVPVIGVVQVGVQQMADRYTYVPLCGLFVMGTWLVDDLVPKARRRLLATCGVALVVVLAIGARAQVQHWRDSLTLFTRCVAVTEANAVAHTNLGTLYGQAGRIEEAVREFRKALEADPSSAGAHGNLGYALLRLGRLGEAETELREALRLDPRFVTARMNYALLLERTGRPAEALEQYDLAESQEPDNGPLRREVATARARLAPARPPRRRHRPCRKSTTRSRTGLPGRLLVYFPSHAVLQRCLP